MEINYRVTHKQREFMRADAFEVLFGGAAGGGKSYGQLIDAFVYAMRYRGSKQLILRRTYPELEKSLIRVAKELYPRALYRYSHSSHTMTLVNGSMIDFGYCAGGNDVYQYQSAEYDVIRFDELTHFSEQQYTYLLSRCRGANDCPKQVKSSTNPGGVGHAWVKERFVDIGAPNTVHMTDHGTRVFIPSLIQDNPILMRKDPEYLTRLQNLGEKERKALLYGDWDIFDGQYFSEFDRDIHVVRPFEIPTHWRRYRVFDYGLDMLACYWIAIDDRRRAVVYRELYEPGLIVSAAADKIFRATQEEIYQTIAPPDMWNRHKDTGRSTAEIFREYGIPLTRASNDRVQGWYNLKEWLRPYEDEQGMPAANLVIFSSCKNLIRTLPAVQIDERNPNDVATEPHELTHAPDALRYFIAGRPVPNRPPTPKRHYNFAAERPKPKPSGYGERIVRI